MECLQATGKIGQRRHHVDHHRSISGTLDQGELGLQHEVAFPR
jgi:hypothetical protein